VTDAAPNGPESGVQAVAWGLADGGVSFTTAYPGFHAHELAARLGCRDFSVNEKNALAVAWGASLAGARAATAFKNVGLNDAADPFLGACALGVNAGMVVVVLDDWDVEQSQLRQDSRPYADFFPRLWLEPCSVGQAYALARQAPALSEELQAPVVLRLTNLLCQADGPVRRQPGPTVRSTFRRAPDRWVVHPVNAAGQQERLGQRQQAIAAWVDQAYPPPPRLDGRTAVRVAAGMAAAGGRVAGPAVNLEVFTLPLPRPWLDALARTEAVIEVAEHGLPLVAGNVAAARGKGRVVAREARAPASTQDYRVFDRYEPLYGVLRGVEGRVIVGDLGGHTMDPARSVDACLCYGCSVGVATGVAAAAPDRRVFCVTGDAAFLHSGKAALAEAVSRRAAVTVIILDNGGSRGTGGQQVPGLCRPDDDSVPWQELDFHDLACRLRPLLEWLVSVPGPRVLRIRTPF
jgi:indolepyruvate ferredoxin oxidoreductase alpha subunit